jgi:hypothetical protein
MTLFSYLLGAQYDKVGTSRYHLDGAACCPLNRTHLCGFDKGARSGR